MSSQKIKSRLKKDSFFMNNFLNNYFAAWIANFGVVPLFLFVAFLLAPAFFFFLNLLFVVTHVLETIGQLLSRYRYLFYLFNNFKPSFLPSKSPCVKGIFAAICTSFLLITPITTNANTVSHDIVLARGESLEIPLVKMAKFNIGNRDIITYRLNEKSKKLLVRGSQLGHSEILVWNHDKTLETYQVFVISKIQEAKFLHLAEFTANLGLDSKIMIPHIRISGILKNFPQYINYKKILEQNKETILDEVKLDNELKNKILGGIYSIFFNDYRDSVNCSAEFSEISCFFPENESPGEHLKKFLTNKYKINLIPKNNQKLNKNYSLKLKLIQLEQLDGEELRLGLEQVSGSLGDFLTQPLERIILKNKILLAQTKVKLSTLAEPQTLIRPLAPSEIQIGAEIPYKNIKNTDWKFSGLKIKIELENYGEKIKINYETELTQPSSDANGISSVSGNKEKSSVVISLNSAVKIFQLSLKTEGKSVDQMPFLHAIPLLGELFKSKSNQSNYKTITGIIEVSENDE